MTCGEGAGRVSERRCSQMACGGWDLVAREERKRGFVS